jgi:hypothetical protein
MIRDPQKLLDELSRCELDALMAESLAHDEVLRNG